MSNTGRSTSPGFDAKSGVLAIPHRNDSIEILYRKMAALADAVRHGHSVAHATNYMASTAQERNATKKAVAEMSLREREVWDVYIQGTYPLPKIDWSLVGNQPQHQRNRSG